MVCVSGGCDGYSPCVALFVGCLSGPLYLFLSAAMVRFHIDDPVDAVAVHLGSGALGLVLHPILRDNGIFFAEGEEATAAAVDMLAMNALGLVVLASYYLVTSVVLFVALDRLGLFRVDPKDEIAGLDQIKHKETAYEFGEINYISGDVRAANLQLCTGLHT